MLIFCAFQLNAQTVWLGNVDSDWTNPGNWSAGVPTSGSTVTLPVNPAGGNSPVFSGSSSIDFTIQNAGILTFNSFVYNDGTVINFGGGQIINNEQFVNGGGRLLDNDGHFENNGILANYGTIDIAASGSLDNESGSTVNNFRSLVSFGPIVNNGDDFINEGTMIIVVSFENNGTLNNYGILEAQFGSAFTSSATIVNRTGAEFSMNGTFSNQSLLRNNGEFLVQNAGVFTNDANIINAANVGEFEIAGNLINNSIFTQRNSLMINSAGRLENNSTVDNSGEITLEICGILV